MAEATEVTYEIVEHDGGWAYKSQGVFSETFPDRDTAIDMARRVAAEQKLPGPTEEIEYEDENGKWKTELADGNDRPETTVIE